MSEYQLPDGREPIRFDKGRAAFYEARRGVGEVRYLFSMIKFIRNNKPIKSKEEIRAINKATANKLKERDPLYFVKIGRKGGASGRKNSKD